MNANLKWFLMKENQSWVASLCVLLVFFKWVVWPSFSEMKVQEKRLSDLTNQFQSLQKKPKHYSAEQVGVLLLEWKTHLHFPIEISQLHQTWICRSKSSDFVSFLMSLERVLSESPLPLQWLEIDLENEEISFGVGDVF
jgi:hypothetical protein